MKLRYTQGGEHERYVIPKSALTACLVEGQNLLAIQVHNVSTNSGDMSAIAYLSFGITEEDEYFEEPPHGLPRRLSLQSLLCLLWL
ncbi:MAG: hypothetical protein M0D57_04295 [Sphingobacteriales bacterium JAD_PAG50586_3]|nr:MAG: hypothetical protein M0D57_04295 [Sphingobacteriales bacterium JAD_PAG50586_3]